MRMVCDGKKLREMFSVHNGFSRFAEKIADVSFMQGGMRETGVLRLISGSPVLSYKRISVANSILPFNP